jgi:hypothetical protein
MSSRRKQADTKPTDKSNDYAEKLVTELEHLRDCGDVAEALAAIQALNREATAPLVTHQWREGDWRVIEPVLRKMGGK